MADIPAFETDLCDIQDDPFSKAKYDDIKKRKEEAEELRRQGIDPEEFFAKRDREAEAGAYERP